MGVAGRCVARDPRETARGVARLLALLEARTGFAVRRRGQLCSGNVGGDAWQRGSEKRAHCEVMVRMPW